MSISTYGELKAAVLTWLDRSDLSSQAAEFVALAEADIRNDVRCQAMEQFTTGTLSGETLAHPTRYVGARSMRVNGYPFLYVPPGVYQEHKDRSSLARVFTSIGQSFYILNGASGDSYALVWDQAFEAFSGDSDTNWLLTNHPAIYLGAASRYGAEYIGDEEMKARYLTMYQDAAGRLMSREKEQRFSGGPLVIQAAVSE